MGTYKESFVNLVNEYKERNLLEYNFYDFSNKTFKSNAQSRICHISLKNEYQYNKDAIVMIFTIGDNVGRTVIQSEGAKTSNPSSTYPQKIEALHLAKENGWKYIALAISPENFPNETIRNYVVSIESTTYAKATVCVLDECIKHIEDNNYPDFYRCRQKANNIEYTLSFIKKNKFIEYLSLFDNRFEVEQADDPKEQSNIFEGFSTWLTSHNNPDYTGKEKYAGYSRALERLLKFMEEKGLINDSNLNDKNIEKYKNIVDIYDSSEEAKDFDQKYLSSKAGIAALKKYIKYIEYLESPETKFEKNSFNYDVTKGYSINKILFGIPGCGKSYHIDHKILGKDKDTKEYCGNYEKENIIRTTFYQDYSNTDFIGQILPKVTKNENGDSVVEYSFNPGPFTLALIQAIKNPTKKVALVIEEINRGNAPAIFGDIFQLLDRDDDSVSQYGIVNVGIIDYLNSLDFDVDGEKIKYIFNEIKIPGNMDIFATMNTSDQNVYTLDTAFTRRWAKERIPNDFGDNEEIKNKAIPGMNEYTWSEFVESINSYIDDHLDDLQINEDKKIGAFFVGLTTLDNVDEFAYKVLDYLWSDVSKLDHNVIFNNYKTFETLIKDYKSKGVKVFRPNIFEEKVAAHPQEEEENE